MKAPRGRFSSMDASLGASSVVGRRDSELKHRTMRLSAGGQVREGGTKMDGNKICGASRTARTRLQLARQDFFDWNPSVKHFPSATRCTMIRRLFSLVEGRVVVEHTVGCSIARRGIAASAAACARKMPDRPPLVHENEFTESFLKGSGPGGQKIVC